jgi:hypothetical protein
VLEQSEADVQLDRQRASLSTATQVAPEQQAADAQSPPLETQVSSHRLRSEQTLSPDSSGAQQPEGHCELDAQVSWQIGPVTPSSAQSEPAQHGLRTSQRLSALTQGEGAWSTQALTSSSQADIQQGASAPSQPLPSRQATKALKATMAGCDAPDSQS